MYFLLVGQNVRERTNRGTNRYKFNCHEYYSRLFTLRCTITAYVIVNDLLGELTNTGI